MATAVEGNATTNGSVSDGPLAAGTHLVNSPEACWTENI